MAVPFTVVPSKGLKRRDGPGVCKQCKQSHELESHDSNHDFELSPYVINPRVRTMKQNGQTSTLCKRSINPLVH